MPNGMPAQTICVRDSSMRAVPAASYGSGTSYKDLGSGVFEGVGWGLAEGGSATWG